MKGLSTREARRQAYLAGDLFCESSSSTEDTPVLSEGARLREALSKVAAGAFDETLSAEEQAFVPVYRWLKDFRSRLHDAIPQEIWDAFMPPIGQLSISHPLIKLWGELSGLHDPADPCGGKDPWGK